MNEFLQQNIGELIRLVTEMVSTGAQVASDQMPELLMQLVAYTLIDAKIGFYVSLVVCTISVVLGIASVIGMYNDSGAAVVGIILCPMALVGSVIVGATCYITMIQCQQTPMVVILKQLSVFIN